MILHKQTLERSPWRDTISIQTVNKDFLSNSAQHNHTKYGTSLYELLPKKFSEFYLVLHKLYRVDTVLGCVGDFIKIDKQHPSYYGFKNNYLVKYKIHTTLFLNLYKKLGANQYYQIIMLKYLVSSIIIKLLQPICGVLS